MLIALPILQCYGRGWRVVSADFFWFVPLLTFASGVLIAAIKMRPANTSAEEAATDGQWKRVTDWCDRLEKRVEVLETEVATCHTERDEARAEALKWKAVAEGVGQNRQEEATILAAKRLAEKGGEDANNK